MPNNFKLRGDYYVSKYGSDSNNGLTPDTPKRTVQAGVNLMTTSNKTLIIGVGVYRENISFAGLISLNGNTIYCDGEVVFDGSFSSESSIRFGGLGTVSPSFWYGGIFKNYKTISFSAGGALQGLTISNAYVDNREGYIKSVGIGGDIQLYKVKLIGGSLDQFGGGVNAYITNSIVINTVFNIGAVIMKDSYFSDSVLVRAGSGIVASNFNWNNIRGSILMNVASSVTSGIIQDSYGRYYDLSLAGSGGSGTLGDPYRRSDTSGKGFYFSAHRTAYPTYNASSSAVDPGFNNILKQDFTLQSSSFMIGKASDFISNIGGTQVATRVDASGSLFSGSNAITDSFVFNSGDYVISGSATTGSVTSAPIFVSSSAKVIQEIDYNGLLAFNKDTTAPTGSNQNVPDVLTYTSASGQPGANPDRLTYYMRWTTGSSQPAADAQWENGGLWPAGSFNVFEWNTKPSVDYLGRGNGDQNFSIVNTPTYVKATWIQLRVTLRNDYLI